MDMDTSSLTINGATPDMVWITLATLLLACGALVTILTLVEKISKLRRDSAAPNESIMEMLKNDKHRLNGHDEDIQAIKGKQRSLE